MAKNFRTGIIIEGDGRGGVKAIRANNVELDKLDKQQRRNTESAKRMATRWKSLERVAKSSMIATAAVATGLVTVAARQARAADEAYTLAEALGTSTGEIQEFGYAAKRAGIESDKASDILKDLGDKIGDAALTGGGELADVLDRIGLSAEDLQAQSPVQALTSIGAAIEDLPSAQQVNILESVADDGSRLLPILKDNAELLRQYKREAQDFGIALTEEDNARLRAANQSMERLYGITRGLSNELAVAMAPSIERAADEAVDLRDVFQDEAFKTGVSVIAGTVTTMATGLADSVRDIGELKSAIEGLDISKIGQFLYSRTLMGWVDGRPDTVNTGVASGTWGNRGASGSWGEPKPEPSAERDSGGRDFTGLLDTYDKRHKALEQLRDDRKKLYAAIDADPANAAAYRRSLAEVNRQIAQMGSTSQKSASKLDSAYDSMRGRLRERMALFDQNSQVARIRYEIEMGSLAGLKPAREEALMQLAREADLLESQKRAVSELFPEFERLQRIKSLQESAGTLPAALQGFGERRADEMLRETAIGGLPRMQGLDPQFNGPFGEEQRLEREREDYQRQYEKRREAFQAYAQAHQEDAARANEAIEILERDHQQRMLQYDQQTQRARRQGYAATFGEITDLVGTFAGEQSAIYKSMFAASKAFAIADSVIQIQNALAKAANVPFPANLAAMGTVAAQTASILSNINSVTLSGQAHDGIDSVPQSGTWNLQKGERVVDSRMNQDLRRFLERESSGSRPQRGGDVVYSPNVTIEAKPGMSDQEVNRQGAELERGLRDGFRRFVIDESRSGGLFENVKIGR